MPTWENDPIGSNWTDIFQTSWSSRKGAGNWKTPQLWFFVAEALSTTPVDFLCISMGRWWWLPWKKVRIYWISHDLIRLRISHPFLANNNISRTPGSMWDRIVGANFWSSAMSKHKSDDGNCWQAVCNPKYFLPMRLGFLLDVSCFENLWLKTNSQRSCNEKCNCWPLSSAAYLHFLVDNESTRSCSNGGPSGFAIGVWWRDVKTNTAETINPSVISYVFI